jgi:hypothetical protein
MTDKEKYEQAITHLAENHCAMVDAREIKEQSYCPFLFDESLTCEDCWRWYLEEGSWWDREIEPDPDRKWKEMHGE